VAKPVKRSDLFRAIGDVLNGTPANVLAGAPSLSDQPPLPLLSILLAEDGLVNQTVARRLLEKQGHSVTVVGDGHEALEALESAAFDVVLMDIQMPELDGLAATVEIRRREGATGKHTPIIAMTANAMKGDRERCLEAGMDGYVSKPIRSRELYAAITEVLSTRAAADTSTTTPIRADAPHVPRSTLAGSGKEASRKLNDRVEPDDAEARVVNWTLALEQAAGDPGIVREMIDVYFEEKCGLLSTIEQAIAAGDAAGLRRAAHTLKGALHHLAADRAAGVAAQLEALGKAGSASEGGPACRALSTELDRLDAELAEFQASGTTCEVETCNGKSG
jgi:CheY-like chemotaxis protein